MARRAIDKGRSVLVLVAEIEQGRGIVELIGDGAVLAHSGMARRKVEIDAFVAGETKCFVTTSNVTRYRFRLHRLPVCLSMWQVVRQMESRSKGQVGYKGRILNKPDAWVIDFRDGHHYFLQAHAKKRELSYRKIGITEK
jgi:hypothetical protein